jgi:hypothetical protein
VSPVGLVRHPNQELVPKSQDFKHLRHRRSRRSPGAIDVMSLWIITRGRRSAGHRTFFIAPDQVVTRRPEKAAGKSKLDAWRSKRGISSASTKNSRKQRIPGGRRTLAASGGDWQKYLLRKFIHSQRPEQYCESKSGSIRVRSSNPTIMGAQVH